MTGKLGQSLRKYNEQQGQPDYELEKFAINSLLSASHTSQMDSEDQKDIIKKVKDGGDKTEVDSPESNDSESSDEVSDTPEPEIEQPVDDIGGEEGLEEYQIFEGDDLFIEPKKNNMFQPGSNDILDETKPCWSGYKQVGVKEKNGKKVPNCVPINENLVNREKSGIFAIIKTKLKETFNQEEMTQTTIEPQTKPKPSIKPDTEQPKIAPSRRNKPFLPRPSVTPDPKATNEVLDTGFGDAKPKIYHNTLSETLDTVRDIVKHRGYDEIEFDINDVQHVGYGHTERFQKSLFIGGKEQRKKLNVQIYRMDNGTYELNTYIN